MSKKFIFGGSYSGVVYLLDLYPSISGYSLRKLSSSITNVIRVRRSSDNAELDFADTDITDGTLTTWTGANDGFVVTWYNQGTGGTSYDMIQATTVRQPKIVSAGVVYIKNGLPTIYFDGSDVLESVSTVFSVVFPYNVSVIALGYNDISNSFAGIVEANFGAINSQFHIDRRVQKRQALLYGATGVNTYDLTAQDDTAKQRLISFFMNSGGACSAFKDSLPTTSGTVTGGSNAIGSMGIGRGNGIFITGGVQEIILNSIDDSTNRVSIETNINEYYSIY